MILAAEGRTAEALRCLQSITGVAPEHEEALAWAAALSEQLGTLELAEDYWRHVLTVNPHFSNYHMGLARLLLLHEHWEEASREAKTALQLNPTRLDARKLLIMCYLRLKNREGLQLEWEKYQGFDPPDLEEVRKLIKQLQ
jgi:tetratricopeptide (TPR) repeat protein